MKHRSKIALARAALLCTLPLTEASGQDSTIRPQQAATQPRTNSTVQIIGEPSFFDNRIRIRGRLVQPAPIDRRMSEDPGLYAESLLIERHLLNAPVQQVRILDFIANSHPDIAMDLIAGIQIKLNQDEYRDAAREWVAAGKDLDDLKVKITSEVLDIYLSRIKDVDPRRVEGTGLPQVLQALTHAPIATLSFYSYDSPYRDRELPQRLSWSHDQYEAFYKQNPDARHELAAKIAIVRKAGATGSINREHLSLFSYRPDIQRDKVNKIFEILSDKDALYEVLPTYDQSKTARELGAALTTDTRRMIDTWRKQDSTADLAYLLDERYQQTVAVLSEEVDAETRMLAYQRLGQAIAQANQEASHRELSGLINANQEIFSAGMNALKRDLGTMADAMGVLNEGLGRLEVGFEAFKKDFPDTIRVVVRDELRQQNFSIAGYSFAGNADENWAQSLSLTYESTRLVQGIAAMSGDSNFQRDAAVTEGIVRGVIGITKGVDQIDKATRALLAAQDGTEAVKAASELSQAVSIVAGVTSIVGAVGSIVSLFSAAGPSPEEVIMDMLADLLQLNQEILQRTYELETNQVFLSRQIVLLQQAVDALANDNREQATAILKSEDYTQLLVRLYSEQVIQALSVSQLDKITAPTISATTAFLDDYEDSTLAKLPNLSEPLADMASFLKTEVDQIEGLYPSISRERVANIDEFGGGGAFQMRYDLTLGPGLEAESVLDQFAYLTELEPNRQQVLLPLLARRVAEISSAEGINLRNLNLDAIANMQNPEAVKEIALTYLSAAPALSPRQAKNDLARVLESRLEEVASANEQFRKLVPIVYDLYIRELVKMRNHVEDYLHMYDIIDSRVSAFSATNPPRISDFEARHTEVSVNNLRNRLFASSNDSHIEQYYDAINEATRQIENRHLLTDRTQNSRLVGYHNILKADQILVKLSEILVSAPRHWNDMEASRWNWEVRGLEKLAQEIGIAVVIDHPRSNEENINWTDRSWAAKDRVGLLEPYREKKNPFDDWDNYTRNINKEISFYSNRYVQSTDLALRLLKVELGEQRDSALQPPIDDRLWYRHWNGHNWWRYEDESKNPFTGQPIVNEYVRSRNEQNDNKIISRINELELSTHPHIHQLREAIRRLVINTSTETQIMWQDMLLGKVDDPQYDLPDYLKFRLNRPHDPLAEVTDRTKFVQAIPNDVAQAGTLTLEKVGNLQSNLQQTLRNLTVLQHAMSIFVAAGWDECVDFFPELRDISHQIQANQLPNFEWLIDPAQVNKITSLHRSIDAVILELRNNQSKFDVVGTIDTTGVCNIGLGQPEMLLASVRELSAYGDHALEAIEIGNRGELVNQAVLVAILEEQNRSWWEKLYNKLFSR